MSQVDTLRQYHNAAAWVNVLEHNPWDYLSSPQSIMQTDLYIKPRKIMKMDHVDLFMC